MARIRLGPNFNPLECLCCGDIYKTGGVPCICKVTSPWWQNQHGEAACDMHKSEKFSVKSLKDIKRERELALRDEMQAFQRVQEEAKKPQTMEVAEGG